MFLDIVKHLLETKCPPFPLRNIILKIGACVQADLAESGKK